MSKSNRQVLFEPVIDNNPITLQVLGICSALAVTTQLSTSVVMCLAVIVVLAVANVSVSVIRNHMPTNIRIIVQMTIISTGVIVVDEILQAFAPEVARTLSVFVSLIVTNCIVLGRAEAFASKNGVFRSLLDGLGIGVGFTLALMALAAVRELLGTGALTFWVTPIQIFGPSFKPFSFMIEAPGAFMALGLMLCLMNLVGKK